MARSNTSRPTSAQGNGRQFQQVLVVLGIALFIVGIVVSGLIGSIGIGPIGADTNGVGQIDDDEADIGADDQHPTDDIDFPNADDDDQETDDTGDPVDEEDHDDTDTDDPPADDADDSQTDDETSAPDDDTVDDADDDSENEEGIWDIEAEGLPDHAYIGETVTVDVHVENIGDGFGETEVTLIFDEEEIVVQSVEGQPGYSTEIRFDFDTSDHEEGSYWMSVRTDDGDIRWMIELESDEDDSWIDDDTDDTDDADDSDDNWDTDDDADIDDADIDDDEMDDANDHDDADDDDSGMPFFT